MLGSNIQVHEDHGIAFVLKSDVEDNLTTNELKEFNHWFNGQTCVQTLKGTGIYAYDWARWRSYCESIWNMYLAERQAERQAEE